ncbi:MAG: hypothetical protein WA896_22075 [Spirulinaceae cyanobacterium]
MSKLKPSNVIVDVNQRSLSTLKRAIEMSLGQFSLILVRCNYVALQEKVTQQIESLEGLPLPFKKVCLPGTVTTLFSNLESEIDSGSFSALIVFGLESVEAIETLLVATNQVRDEFRKHFSLPLVLWITDDILQKLTRFAPDFKSWASTSIKFELPSQELIKLWQQTIGNAINQLLEAGGTKFLPNQALNLSPGGHRRQALEYAKVDLRAAQIDLEPIIEAILSFLLGRDAYVDKQIDQALYLYQQSWNSLKLAISKGKQESYTNEMYGLLLFHMALCHCHQARQSNSPSHPQWGEAKQCFQLSIELFAVENHLEWVAELTIKLSEVLQQMRHWEELQAVTLLSLKQSATYNSTQRLGRAYGFLAQVALANADYQDAKSLAENALEVQSISSSKTTNQQALYLFLLAQAQGKLGETKAALKNLERAKEVERSKPNLQENPQLYLQILAELGSLYFSQQDYLGAFKLKQEKQSIEQQCGLRAFLGTSPSPSRLLSHLDISRIIATSGRQRDINNLIERLSSSHHKLTVIHGSSGVGKSYLIKTGLVPSLWGEIIGAREVLPIVQTVRWDWEKDLTKELARATKELHPNWELKAQQDQPATAATILKQLQHNAEGNFLTVLIFDQFEELFFLCTEITERFKFYRFLKDCLNIPYIKVVLSLREDYLHHLLHWERLGDLDVIDNNILTRQSRYHFGELSHEEALNMIKTLTAQSQFQLEDSLIKVLAQDLALARGTVRPVELQVVGAQLQTENIATLQEYRQLGPDPKTVLVGHSLQEVISDCGQENEDAVWQVLFSLTNERGTRPLKTKADLVNLPESGLSEKRRRNKDKELITNNQLNLILNVLVDSGLVFRVREEPEDRYQIVHDYLVPTIRNNYKRRIQQVIEARLNRNQLEISLVRRQRLQAMAIGATMAVLAVAAGAFGWRSEVERKVAYNLSVNAELNALSASSETLFVSNKPFDALLEGLRAAYRLKSKEKAKIKSDTILKVTTALEQAVYGVIERNRLEGHDDVVWGISFSSDGQTIATASRDKTIKIWHPDGSLVQTLTGHDDSVTSVVFNPDGSLLASSSWDGTVKLWQPDGEEILTIPVQSGNVYSVNFSSDGQYLITAGGDGLVKLWNLQGQLLKTISGHFGAVNWATFSPDGQLIASAGEDNLVKLWSAEGELLKNLQGHSGKVNHLAFSPDGKTIASVSDDKTVKLWNLDGQLINTLQGHEGWVFSVGFSPDGQLITSASDDNQIKLWSREGKLLQTLKGHGDGITGVGFSPDGQTLASTSYDKTIKLWGRSKLERRILRGHTDEVKDVDFSPDGELIVSAGKDGTGKLWSREGQLLATLGDHTEAISSVSFSPDGELIASASHDKTIKLWSRSGELLKTLSGHEDWVLDVAWSNNNQLLASASRDKKIKLWNVQDGVLQNTLIGHTERVNSVSFSQNDQILASGSDDKTLKLWIASQDGTFSSQRVKTLSGNNSWVLDTSFSPPNSFGLIPTQTQRAYFPFRSQQFFKSRTEVNKSNQILASAGYDNTVRLWNLRGEKLKTLKGHTDSVAHLSFNPTGEIIATTTWDKTIQLWRLDDTLLHSLEGHQDRVTSVSWSKDGKAIATGSSDHTIIIWNLDTEELTNLSCDWLKNYLQNNPQVRSSDRNLCK